MGFNEHSTEFANKPVADWDIKSGIQAPLTTIYRLSVSYDEVEEGQTWVEKFNTFMTDPSSSQVVGIVVGDWGQSGHMETSSASVVEALVEARNQLKNLKAIFLGDIISEECEISWLNQSDVSSLFSAYPELEHFCVRGGEKLTLGTLNHPHLKSLTIQTGGLSVEILNSIISAQLPELEHLELWLGEDSYGGNITVTDLAPLLDGQVFSKLTYLGLRDSEIADQIAQAIATAPVLEKIKILDLSMGTLSDTGAAALTSSPLIHNLEKLDVHHHYCSAEMVELLTQLKISVDVSEPKTADVYDNESWRYVAVGE